MKRKKQLLGAGKQAIALILCAIVLIPFAIIVVNALKTSGEAKLMRLTWPSNGVQWDNFQKVIDRGNLVSAFFNRTLSSALALRYSWARWRRSCSPAVSPG